MEVAESPVNPCQQGGKINCTLTPARLIPMEASTEDCIDWDTNIYAADNTQARLNRINCNNTRPEDAYSWRSLLDSLDHVSTGQTLPPKETEFPSVVNNPQATDRQTAFGDLRDSSTIVLAKPLPHPMKLIPTLH